LGARDILRLPTPAGPPRVGVAPVRESRPEGKAQVGQDLANVARIPDGGDEAQTARTARTAQYVRARRSVRAGEMVLMVVES
jgi:hypothetical protein